MGNQSGGKYTLDYTNLYTDYLPIFSGNWNNGTNAGTFRLYVGYSASSSSASLGGRLMYL